MATTANSPILQSDIDALFAVANTKTFLVGAPYSLVEGPQWDSGTTYAAGDLVIFNGHPFISKVNGNTFPPTCVALWQGVTDRGAWNSTTIYNPLDMVTWNDNYWVDRKYITLNGCAANIPPQDMNNVGSSHWQQFWLSAYNAMRSAVLGYFYQSVPSVSGPWPLTPTGITSFPGSPVAGLYFYYPDTGASASVTYGGIPATTFFLPVDLQSYLDEWAAGAGIPYDGYADHGPTWRGWRTYQHMQMLIGGTQPVTLTNGKFSFAYNATSVSITTDVPGLSFIGGTATFTSLTLNPGTYNFYITINGLNGMLYYFMQLGGNGTIGISVPPYSTSEEVPGIHSSLPVRRISCDTLGGWDGYLCAWRAIPINIGSKARWIATGPDAAAGPSKAKYTATVPGAFFGKSAPIKTLGLPQLDGTPTQTPMPWNLLYRTDSLLSPNHYGAPYGIPPMPLSNPYQVTLTISGTTPHQTISAGPYSAAYGLWEREMNPPAWRANTWYPTGFKIRDKNGNIQTMVTPTGGLTGAYYPGLPPDESLFSTVNGVVMTEATGGYELNGVKHSLAQWKCTVVNKNTTDTWKTAQAYPVGTKITDKNWNTETVVSGWFPNHAYAEGALVTDDAGISQLAITGGVSGATAPSWHGALGATTSDGSVVWESTGSPPLTTPGMEEPAWPTPNLGLAVLKPDWSLGMLCRTQDSVTIGTALYQCTQGGFSKTLELVSLALINGVSFADGNVIWKRISDTSTAPAWVVNMDYSSGTVIVDSNGNEQSCVQIGVAGTTPPTWSTILNGLTNDGTAQWKCTRLGTDNITCDNGVNWRLTALPGLPVTPAVARQYCIPKYPVVRYGGNYPFPEGFNPVGWWIYEVTLNRLGKDDGTGVMQPQSGSVPVTLGCMRNGSFVSFGTWNTGQTIPAMWPIFTAGPLVYQCSETVDVQAVAITCGLNFQTGGEVTYPICAAYYNDMMALLGLIS